VKDLERQRDYLENLKVDWMIILKCVPKSQERAWPELIWLRIGTGGGLL
jgi:hypothetical protein